jgi:hypothetical protein
MEVSAVMKRSISLFLAAATVIGMSGCARSLAEGHTSMGFRNQKVVFIVDQADIAARTTAPNLEKTPYFQDKENLSTVLRQATRDSLVAWGADCGAHFFPKEGSYSLRMGLMRAADGWNVADASVVKNYARATSTDYLVMVNRIEASRSEIRGASGHSVTGADIALDISVIDARQGVRVVRETPLGHSERSDSLSLLMPQALGLAVDNFFVSVPEAARWGCKELTNRFK